jgi:nitronate monooxygenase
MDVADRYRLDVPVGQAGMGGGLAGATLAAAVAEAGGLGMIGIATPRQLRTSIDRVREQAPGRVVAVNLLMPFARRHHVRSASTPAWTSCSRSAKSGVWSSTSAMPGSSSS